MTLEDELRGVEDQKQEDIGLRAALKRERQITTELREELGLTTRIQGAVIKPPKWTVRRSHKGGKRNIDSSFPGLTSTRW